jgi:sec-independent protein translocase protein TatC
MADQAPHPAAPASLPAPVAAPEPAAAPSELDGARMPFLEHLRELRLRLRNAILALAGGFLLAYWFREEIFVVLLQPLLSAWQIRQAANPSLGPPDLHFGSLAEPFWTYLSQSFWAGMFVAAPVAFYQLWKFIAPGLYAHEKRLALPFAATSAVFFAAGATFCYFAVLPVVYEFFLSYSDANLASMQSVLGDYQVGNLEVALRPTLFMKEYLSLAKKLLLGFGLIFELPLLIFFLALTGAVTHRSLWKFNRWAVILAFIVGAALTPPDPVSQALMAGPIIVLYNLSIAVAYVVTVQRERAGP